MVLSVIENLNYDPTRPHVPDRLLQIGIYYYLFVFVVRRLDI